MTRIGRWFLIVLNAGTVVYALGVIVFGVIDLVTQLANGNLRVLMYWAPGEFSYRDADGGGNGVQVSGDGGQADTIVTGLSASTIVLGSIAVVVGMLTQVALAVLAVRMLGRLQQGRPFDRAAWREVALSSGIVLGLGIASQLLAWWVRVAVVTESGGMMFSTAFVFEPLTVTIGLTLAIVAMAFRSGARLQRDTEGLV
ncbi:MAG TPA: hypothetical protein VGO65_09810 [Pseudolysinimonas sp.]|jgi:hypothetical protein|nr:hypothetical protein [Pseudolysinimonas sp.]